MHKPNSRRIAVLNQSITEVAAVIEAVDRGELSREDIDRKCRKVLTYKYILGLKRKPTIQLSGLGSRINTPQTRDLIRRLNLAAITVLNNKGNILPLHSDKEMPNMKKQSSTS